MSHTPITAAQTDVDSPGDQTLFDLIRLADVDITTRVAALEDPATFYFNHFEKNHQFTSGVILDSAGAASLKNYDKDFTFYVNNGTWTEQIAVGSTDLHWLNLARNGVGGPSGAIELNRVVYYDNRVKPITFECRIRMIADGSFWFGLGPGGAILAARPSNGILLESDPGDTTNWRFVSINGGSATQGSNFAKVTDDTWFKLTIFWDAAGASCKINDIEKELLTATLPTAKQLLSSLSYTLSNASANVFRVDKWKLSLGGPLADAA